jgi:hypothetical protein
MSVEAIKINELIEEAADLCENKARQIQDLVNEEVRTGEFLIAAECAVDDLKKLAKDIRDLTLDEQEV